MYLIMRNMTFRTFSTDGSLFVSTTPGLLNQSHSSTSCLLCSRHPIRRKAWLCGGGRIRGVIVDLSSRLTFRLPRRIPKLLQMNAACASAGALGGGGEGERVQPARRLEAELSNGPLERKILNIYRVIYICLISPPPSCVSAPLQKYAGPVSSRRNQTLPCNIKETRSEGPVQCDLKNSLLTYLQGGYD